MIFTLASDVDTKLPRKLLARAEKFQTFFMYETRKISNFGKKASNSSAEVAKEENSKVFRPKNK